MNIIKEIQSVCDKLLQREELKNLAFFLLINLLFMFVEVVYGLISNSLGLLTDGAHMLLDCSAIIIGLYSSYLSDKSKNHKYNFGYLRSEILGTFINSVFLVFISIYIVFESFERFLQPEEIHSDHLILVSFIGLIVNLIGIYFLHGEYGFHSNCNQHSHTENCSEIKCNHDVESGVNHEKKENVYNENLYAIYIHIVADALGSISVLISSYLIHYYKWNWADPVSSLFISIMILYSVWPVLKNSMFTLLHFEKPSMIKEKIDIEKKIIEMNMDVSIADFDIWELNSDKSVCSLKLHYTPDKSNANEIYEKVKHILKSNKISEYYIELI